ncbi:hypothetical protein HGM15179_018016 [Zosterops borbonicus]|uniref:Uncharacterized protein n=1 Tax=Zosterops borbonicus TaxID=364589 RepID=A0A8K1LCP6_9PASS|nr:hypothetical protein HGM15179_018016 [Zosterops borbonicus]
MGGPSGGCPPAAAPSRAKLLLGIVFSTALFCREGAAAAVLCLFYGHSDDRFWLALTIFFVLCLSVLHLRAPRPQPRPPARPAHAPAAARAHHQYRALD